MKKLIYATLALLFIAMLGTSLYYIDKINRKTYAENLTKKSDNALQTMLELIEAEKERALSIAVLLAQKESIIQGYALNDRKKLFEEINSVIESLKSNGGEGDIDIQLHTSDLRAYVRSWDFDTYDIDLSSFRYGLLKVKNKQAPSVGIELGKRLNIKAIAPILKNGNFLGSAEVIVGFDRVEKKLSQKHFSFIVLLEKEFLSIATDIKRFDDLGKFANTTDACNSLCLKALKNLNLTKDFSGGYFEEDDFVFGFLPLYGAQNERLGLIGVGFEKILLGGSYLLRAPSFSQEMEVYPSTPSPAPVERNGVVIR